MTSIGKINQATKRGKTIIDRMVEGRIRTDSQETGKIMDIPVECAKNIHIQSYLNAQSF